MPRKKTSIKALPESETGNKELNKNKCVFVIFCKNVIDELKREISGKPATIKQIMVYSLLSMDESSKREAMELIKQNKKFDRVVERFIKENRKKILEFFFQQKDSQNNVTALKKRVAELEAMVEAKDDKEYI